MMQLSDRNPADILAVLTKIAKDAGKVILSYRNGSYAVQSKADDSPVTTADLHLEGKVHSSPTREYKRCRRMRKATASDLAQAGTKEVFD